MYEKETLKLIENSRKNIYVKGNFIISKFLSKLNKGKEAILDYFTTTMIVGYRDVQGKDLAFTTDKYGIFPDSKCYILTKNGKYLGHNYSWSRNKDVVEVQGIRTSIKNTLNKYLGCGIKNTALIITDSIVETAIKDGYKKVIVLEPLKVMVKILQRYGFSPILEDYAPNYIFDLRKSAMVTVQDYTLLRFTV